MRRTMWLRVVLVAAIALGGLAFWGLRTTTDVQVTTAAVTAGPIVRRVVAAGTLQAETTVEVGTEVSGVVQSLAADYNSLVHAGQVVARLDPASFVAQLRVAEAAGAQTQASLLRAQAVVLRGSRRERTVRIPNSALAFRPSPEVLHALGEVEPLLPDSATLRRDGDRAPNDVWEFDRQQFTPIGVRAGLADDGRSS